jgi:hypothetical protein
VRSVREGLGQGSDHRPIIAELVLRQEEVARPLMTALFGACQRFAGRQRSVIKA